MTSIKLNQTLSGDRVVITALRGGRQLNSSLAGMGLGIGLELEVIEPEPRGGGAMLVATGGSRLMLSCGMAEKIMVRK